MQASREQGSLDSLKKEVKMMKYFCFWFFHYMLKSFVLIYPHSKYHLITFKMDVSLDLYKTMQLYFYSNN